MLRELTNHLWQSTLFAAVVALLVFGFRKNRAQVRYWLWFSASFKFFVPFLLLVNLGRHFTWAPVAQRAAGPMSIPAFGFAMMPVSDGFPEQLRFVTTESGAYWPFVIAGLWACGFVTIALMRLDSYRRIRAAVRSSVPVERAELPVELEVRSSSGLLEPGVVGVFRPVLLLPASLSEHLTSAQLRAVLAHEMCHVRRHDNLFASIHMFVESIFWFHPLVWWIGARMVEERERACDEAVLLLTGEPRSYAEGILNVCKLCVESPLACVAGITGAVTGGNLRRRIESIMANHIGQRLNVTNKVLLVFAGMAALVLPFVIGMGNAVAVRAQSPGVTGLRFDVASIKPNNSGDGPWNVRLPGVGRVRALNATLRSLITTAYSLPDLKLSGGPAWMDSARFDIDARGQGKNPDEVLAMLQTLLAERFQLKVHRETKELPIYALLVAKNGPKLDPPRGVGCFDPASVPAGGPPPEPNPGEGPVRPCGGFNIPSPGQMYGAKVPMWRFAMMLTRMVGRIVANKTGLEGPYDITLRWNPNETQSAGELVAGDNSGPSIFTAMQEQLGLRLEAQKGPVEVLIVDRAERPSEN
jgi:bla regulator protein BlaR1